MSKGLGKIEREIAWLIPNFDNALSVEELCAHTYCIPYASVEHKHRVAVVRAGNRMIERGYNYAWYGKGKIDNAKVLYLRDDITAYAKARVKSHTKHSSRWFHSNLTFDERLKKLMEWMEPGQEGHIEFQIALLNGGNEDDKRRAAELTIQLEKERERKLEEWRKEFHKRWERDNNE